MATILTHGVGHVGQLELPGGVRLFAGAGAPSNGTSGTGAGKAGPGSLYVDKTNAKLYQNTNTKASPTWSSVGDIATADIADNAITAAKIAAAVAGAGLTGGGGSALAVVVDDATLEIATDTVRVKDAGITAAKLANGAGLAALIAAGLGASASYAKTTSGAQTLLAADAAARVVVLVVVVTQTFAAGDGAATVFDFGETDTPEKYKADLNTGTAGSVLVYAGSLTANKALLVSGTAATGTGTGAVAVTALVLPAAA